MAKSHSTRHSYFKQHHSGLSIKQHGSGVTVGNRFGDIAVLGWQFRWKRVAHVVCECSCGTCLVMNVSNLASGHSTSCGCRRPELVSRARRRHGLTHTSIYTKWVNMRNRCTKPSADSYALYGGRGVRVCAEWDQSFEAFLLDMGECPEGLTLERKDPNGNYTPDNCIWASRQDQANNRRNNRRFEWRGQHRTLRQICTEAGANYELACRRLKRRWSLSEALFHPKGKRRCVDGRSRIQSPERAQTVTEEDVQVWEKESK